MAAITKETQRVLRNEIEIQFGHLLELVLNDLTQYQACANLNKLVIEYMGNAQILTDTPKELVNIT